MDPRANDSGTKTGRRRLSKRGPAELRRLLFNAAMSGVRTPIWNPMYLKARAAGKTSTEALIIVARKILRVAFSLFKTKSTFEGSKFLNAHA
jgi:transposase